MTARLRARSGSSTIGLICLPARCKSRSDAIRLYRDGLMDELKAYCLKDVELTKQLYDLYRTQGFLLVPMKETGENAKVEFSVPVATGQLF